MNLNQIVEKRWKNEAEEGKEYLEAGIESSEYLDQVRVGEVEYKFNPSESLLFKHALDKASSEEEIYDEICELKDDYDEKIASVTFDGWIGDYFGEMEAQLGIQINSEEGSNLYWEIDEGAADLDKDRTEKAVAQVEDALESTKYPVDRIAEIEESEEGHDWEPVNRALVYD